MEVDKGPLNLYQVDSRVILGQASVYCVPWNVTSFEIPETEHYLHEISQYHVKIAEVLKQHPIQFKEIKKKMTYHFIHDIIIGEGIGQCSYDFIHQVLNSYLTDPTNKPQSQIQLATINLWEAWRHLENIFNESDLLTFGMIDLNECVLKCHRLAMNGLMKNKTPPGNFTVLPRLTHYDGILFNYPQRFSLEQCEKNYQQIIDDYNALLEGIKGKVSTLKNEQTVLETYKSTAVLIDRLLSEHSFADGNGRLTRLLASYSLQTLIPFPITILNRDQYFKTLCYSNKTKLAEIVMLLLESTKAYWQYFWDISSIYGWSHM